MPYKYGTTRRYLSTPWLARFSLWRHNLFIPYLWTDSSNLESKKSSQVAKRIWCFLWVKITICTLWVVNMEDWLFMRNLDPKKNKKIIGIHWERGLCYIKDFFFLFNFQSFHLIWGENGIWWWVLLRIPQCLVSLVVKGIVEKNKK